MQIDAQHVLRRAVEDALNYPHLVKDIASRQAKYRGHHCELCKIWIGFVSFIILVRKEGAGEILVDMELDDGEEAYRPIEAFSLYAREVAELSEPTFRNDNGDFC